MKHNVFGSWYRAKCFVYLGLSPAQVWSFAVLVIYRLLIRHTEDETTVPTTSPKPCAIESSLLSPTHSATTQTGTTWFHIILHFFILFFVFALLLLLPPSCHPDPRSLNRLFSPLRIAVRTLHLYREKSSAISSLVGLRRIVPTCLPTL